MNAPAPEPAPEPARSHPIEDIPGLPASTVETLRSHWFETAEQVLAVAAHDQGQAGLRALLSLTPAEMDTLLVRLHRIVGEPTAHSLRAPAPPRSLGLLVPPKPTQAAGTEDRPQE